MHTLQSDKITLLDLLFIVTSTSSTMRNPPISNHRIDSSPPHHRLPVCQYLDDYVFESVLVMAGRHYHGICSSTPYQLQAPLLTLATYLPLSTASLCAPWPLDNTTTSNRCICNINLV
ncbi:hypothetical protein [Absidia glauca]|uniref:Ndc10 domain-containing protein n=1 Tax=Absidia glauca TaxID=4829 RepID=A0A168Q2W2_ABSGL|nr:hypothetical protein [Absidia glauca]